MTTASIFKNYKRLSRISAELLTSPNLITGDITLLQEQFMESFCDTLKAALQLNVVPQDIKNFHKKTNGNPNDVEIFDFISDKIESPKSYIVLNFFLAHFVISFLKNSKPEFKKPILELLESQQLDVTALDQIENCYKSLV
jgi:hypothetical protein